MVAIFTGFGSGFERGSLTQLGGAGLLGGSAFGRAGEGVFLNASNGNLIVSRQDEFLVGRGPDIAIARTYNSRGALDDNGDNWRQSSDRRIIASGTLNTLNHTVVRVSADGSEVTYTYNNWGDGSYYRATDGSGAHDKLVHDGANWNWTEGSTQIRETYGVWTSYGAVSISGGTTTSWIARQYDPDLNNVTFEYVAGKLTRIATANHQTGAQSAIEYGWTNNDITSVVTKYKDFLDNLEKTLTRTTYTYANNRLSSVTVDETPENTGDNATAENIYTISYTYDVNGRISTISQTDGSSLTITYDGQGRVWTLSQVVGADTAGVAQPPRVTSIAYFDEGNGLTRTEVTDPRNQITKIWSKNLDNATTIHTDERGQLMRVQAPAAYDEATPQEVSYTYDGFGNVVSITDAPGSVRSFVYDTAGNAIRITDPNGHKTYRAYDIGANFEAYVDSQADLLTAYNTNIAGTGRTKADWGEEHWVMYGSGEGRTLPLSGIAGTNALLREVRIATVEGVTTQVRTRFVYDGENHLRYAISGEGRVTEYRYRGTGELDFGIEYPQHLYAIGWTRPSETQMNAWRDALADRSTTKITQFVYDTRGNLIETYANGVATAAGAGAASEGYSHSVLSYDQSGLLRRRQVEGQQVESFFYDGMGRLTASTDLAGGTTTIVFADVSDVAGKTYTTVTTGAGFTTVSSYNKAGDLLSTNTSGSNAVPGSASYLYDKNGRVRRVTIANGAGSASELNHSYVLYDKAGRKIADIGQGGELTEYRYDAQGRVVATARFNTPLTAPQISLLDNPNSEIELSSIRPTASAGDLWQWTIYDSGGRVVETILGDGSVTTYAYDASDRLIATTRYTDKVDVSTYATTAPIAQATPTGGVSSVTRVFYDRDGRAIATLGPEGAMTRIFYDGAGQKVMETRYASLTEPTLRASGTLAQLLASFSVDASKDMSTRYVYDGQGLLRFTIDAMNRVTEFVYHDGTLAGANGLVRKTITYAASLGSLANNLYATVKSAVAALASSANDRVSYNVYNNRGQLAYRVDAAGAVTGFVYDALGRVTKTTRFAALYNTAAIGADSAWQTNLDSWALSNGAGARIDRNWWGARAGDLIYTIDAEGYVTKFDYEAQGRVFTEYRFANKITVSDNASITAIDAINKGAVATTSYRYDALGRLHDTYDANGTRYFTIYNANGLKAYDVIAFMQGASDDSWTGYEYDLAGRVKTETRAAGTAEMSVTQYAYDGLGNLSTITDPRNVVTSLSYDKAGRVLSRKEASGTASERTTIFDYDAFGRAIRTTVDPAGLNIQTYAYFDRLSRVTKTVDGESYVTETSYSPFGEVGAITRRANKATSYSLTAEPTVAANAAFDATTTYEYDKLSRLTKTIDAMGGVTQFKLNAFGQTVKTTDALGNVAYAYYDLLGRVALGVDVEGYVTKTSWVSPTQTEVKRYINKATGAWSETAPPVEGASSGPAVATNALDGTTTYVYDGIGRLIDETNAVGVVTHYVYDRRGNVTQKIEGFGLGASERRTTNYAYDDLDRVTTITHDQIAAAQSSTGVAVTPTEFFFYDAAGNLVEKSDISGARTLYWYNALGQVKYQLVASELSGADKKGTLTRHDYDASGNVTETRVFGALVTLPVGLPGSAPIEPGAYRRTLYVYDKLGRLTETQIPDMRTAVYADNTFTVTSENSLAILRTKYEYDALGNTLRVTDANQNKTWSYYDKLGRKIAQIDAGNYRTDWTFNANSNVTSEKRYAVAGTIPGNSVPITLGVLPSSLPALDSANDRVTNFTHDKIGRVLTETRTGVLVHNGSGAHTTVNAVITYTYNALGAVLSKQEASGDTISYTYDKAGRLMSEERAGFTDFAGATNVKPRVEYIYNALNDVTQTKAVGNANAAERITSYVYAAGGLLASKTDAALFTRNFVYDDALRVKREEYVRVKPDGSSVTEASAYDYDFAGRVTRQGVMVWTAGAWSRKGAAIDTAAMKYNAYGEISERGLAHYDATTGAETLNLAEKFEYDGAGRISRTNSGDGTWRYFMYDAAGNQTLGIQSVGADLNATATDTLQEVLDLWAGGTSTIATNVASAGVVATITSYDARNNAIEVREPQRQLTATAPLTNLVTTRAYNAFGDTAYEINALNARIDYTYNTMGRIVKVESPGVSVTAANGTVANNVRPTEHRYYDASGRSVAGRDANSNLTKYTLLSGTGYNGAEALITEVWNADGGVIRTKYDIHGDARRIENALYHATTAPQHVRTQSFDKMGRLVQVNQEGGLIEYYRYDGLGQRIRRFNSFYNASYSGVTDPTGAAASEAEKTFYDAQGRIVQQIAPGGDVTSYAYAWDSALVTGGMTTAANPFGGWTQTITYANAKTLIEKSDIFGRIVSKTDLGANVTGYTYDMAGRLTQRTGGITLNQTYFNTGKLSKVSQNGGYVNERTIGMGNWERETISYREETFGYDALGNVVAQKLRETGLYEWSTPGHIDGEGMWEPGESGADAIDQILSDQTAVFDALGRIVQWNELGGVKSPIASHIFQYDANGNVRRSLASYRALSVAGGAATTPTTQDYWYRFDAMNRMTTAKGTLSGGVISRGATGVDIFYRLDGTRAYTLQGSNWREDYTYDAEGRVTQVRGGNNVSSPGIVRGAFTYDALGRQLTQIDYNGTSGYLGGGANLSRTVVYNAKNQIVTEDRSEHRNDDIYRTFSTFSYGTGSNYALGAVVEVVAQNWKDGAGWPTTKTTNTYAWRDGAVQTLITHDPDNNPGTNNNKTSTFTYDIIGGQAQLRLVTIADGQPRTITFTSDMLAQAIRREERGGSNTAEVWYRYSGRQMGRTGYSVETNVNYYQSNGNRVYGANHYSNADFDLAYDHITTFEQGSAGGSYTVQSGDTLASIAANLWGDSSLWYKLAEANGLGAESPLIEGQTLIVPVGVQTSANNSTTFKPYDPLEVLGNVSPTAAKPKKDKNCGLLGTLVVQVVAFVVAAVIDRFVPGAGTYIGKVLTQAVSNAAGQGVAIAAGVQEKFSWNQVGMAAVGAAVGESGIGNFIASKVPGGEFARLFVKGAINDAITQGIGKATGMQEKFSWASVAAAGLSQAYVGRSVGEVTSVGKFVHAFAARTLISATMRSLIDGDDFGDAMMEAMPGAFVASLGDYLNDTAEARAEEERARAVEESLAVHRDIVAMSGDLLGPAAPAGASEQERMALGSTPVADMIALAEATRGGEWMVGAPPGEASFVEIEDQAAIRAAEAALRQRIIRDAALAGAGEVSSGAAVILWTAEQRARASLQYGEDVARVGERFGLDVWTSEGLSAARTFINIRRNWNSAASGSPLTFQNPNRVGEAQFVVVMDAELDNPGIFNRASMGDPTSREILQGAVNFVNQHWSRDQIVGWRQTQPGRLAEALPELYDGTPTQTSTQPQRSVTPGGAVQTRGQRPRFDPYVRFNPTAFNPRIEREGLLPSRHDNKIWFTRFSDVRHVTSARSLETIIYRQNLHEGLRGFYASGATLRLVRNVSDARPAGLTNLLPSGIRQWYVERPIPYRDISRVIKTLPAGS